MKIVAWESSPRSRTVPWYTRSASRRDALRDIATICDERGIKVRTLSTAQTIESDLHGPREHVGNGRRRDDPHGAPAAVVFPEPALLSLIGRADLFEREVGRGASV